jgi:sensor histidine kinase YesM
MQCYTSHSSYYYYTCYYYYYYYYKQNWTSHSSANNALYIISREVPQISFAFDIAMSGQYEEGHVQCLVRPPQHQRIVRRDEV